MAVRAKKSVVLAANSGPDPLCGYRKVNEGAQQWPVFQRAVVRTLENRLPLVGSRNVRFAHNGSQGALPGFSLVELLITTVVVAALISLAAPSFKTMLLNNRLASQMDTFFSALNFARNSALSDNSSVKVCPFGASGSANCGTSWSAGWIVVDEATNNLLLSHSTTSNDAVLSSVAISGVSALNVTFDARGLTTTQANFKMCDSRGSVYARSLEVLPTGFVQMGSTVGQAVWDSSSLTCP